MYARLDQNFNYKNCPHVNYWVKTCLPWSVWTSRQIISLRCQTSMETTILGTALQWHRPCQTSISLGKCRRLGNWINTEQHGDHVVMDTDVDTRTFSYTLTLVYNAGIDTRVSLAVCVCVFVTQWVSITAWLLPGGMGLDTCPEGLASRSLGRIQQAGGRTSRQLNYRPHAAKRHADDAITREVWRKPELASCVPPPCQNTLRDLRSMDKALSRRSLETKWPSVLFSQAGGWQMFTIAPLIMIGWLGWVYEHSLQHPDK